MANVSDPVSFGHPEIIPATREEMPVIANLLELYAHDFSEFHRVEPGPDGRFGYPELPLYWSEPGRRPFLIRVGGKLAGFVLVRGNLQAFGDDAAWDMSEFFVLRAYRRRGVGQEAAHSVWRQFPGRWQVRVMRANQGAHKFWQRAIAGFTGGATAPACVEKASETWIVFSFDSSWQS
jgi:predicted acetyltransferase